MTDKVQKIREEIERLQDATMDENRNFRSDYDEGKFDALTAIDNFLDSLQEEPVSEDVVSVAKQYIDSHVFGNEEDKFTRSVFVDMFCSGAKWQKQQDSIPTKDLEELISTLSKRYPEVSFAKLSRIAVRVAKWQEEQIMECLLSEVLPCFMHGGEADEVVAKLDEVLNQKK